MDHDLLVIETMSPFLPLGQPMMVQPLRHILSFLKDLSQDNLNTLKLDDLCITTLPSSHIITSTDNMKQ